MPLNITQSHKIDHLFYQFMLDVQQDKHSIFIPHYVVTPNPSVKQWLIQKIAQYNGVCSQVQWFQNVNELEWFLYQFVANDDDKDHIRKANLPRVVMKWKIYQYLLKWTQTPEHNLPSHHVMYDLVQHINQYCVGIHDAQQAQLKRQQMAYWLSEQIAQIFRNYMRYRPQWLVNWCHDIALDVTSLLNYHEMIDDQLEKAQGLERWQRALWKDLFAEDYQRIVHIKEQFFNQSNLTQILPSCIYIFTVLDLASTEWAFLRHLAQYVNIQIYHFSATQEYWADSVDPRWKAEQDEKIRQRLLTQYSNQDLKQIQEYIYKNQGFDSQLREDRHPILTRFGKQARDNFSLLAELSGGEQGGEWIDLFHSFSFQDGQFIFQEEINFADHLLGRLQHDIFYLVNPKEKSYQLKENDCSIQFHVCHSTLRQLEVLKEQLNLWLAQSTPEQPRYLHDILVLAPNIQDIEPMIRCTFVGKNSPAINITGIVPLHIRALWQAFTFPMIWRRGRFTLEDLLDWLNLLAIRQFYHLNDEKIERIGELLKQAGFKRGFDAQHLKLTLHENDRDFKYSFKYALDRLAMSIAVDDESVCHFTEEPDTYIVSMHGVRTEDFHLISILLEIYQYFDERRDWIEQQTFSVEYWLQQLLQDIQRLQRQNVDYTDVLQKTIKQYDRMLSLTYNYDQTVRDSLKELVLPLWDILQEIQSQLESLQEDVSFTGRINFSQIGQIRPLPYQLIVLLNMDNGVFPYREYPKPFDLLNYTRTQLGDRSRLEDHQGAFLDAILQAQQQVWFFYTGFDLDSGEKLDPSSIIIELQHHLSQIIDDTHEEEYQPNKMNILPHLAPLYYIHAPQPFIADGYLNPKVTRQHDDWFDIAQVLYQPHQAQYTHFSSIDEMVWRQFLTQPVYQPFTCLQDVINHYALDPQQIIQLNASYWIKLLRFPARLYLAHFNISHHLEYQNLDSFEPLILNHLEQYQLLNHLIQQEESLDNYAIQPKFEHRLPVGKIKQAYWQSALEFKQKMQNKLEQHVQNTPIHHQIWQWQNLQFNLVLPQDKVCQHWGRMFAQSSKGKYRLQIWIEYLLWLSALDLGDQGADYKMTSLFKDCMIVQTGLSSKQAQQHLLQWIDLYYAGQQQPILLPADLLLHEKFALYNKKGEASVLWSNGCLNANGLEQAYKLWSDSGKFRTESEANHPDWAFLLQGINDSQDLLEKSLQQYSRLYASIWQLQEMKEMIGE